MARIHLHVPTHCQYRLPQVWCAHRRRQCRRRRSSSMNLPHFQNFTTPYFPIPVMHCGVVASRTDPDTYRGSLPTLHHVLLRHLTVCPTPSLFWMLRIASRPRTHVADYAWIHHHLHQQCGDVVSVRWRRVCSTGTTGVTM